LVRDDHITATILTHRGRTRGVPDPKDRHAFEVLAPHALSALELQIKLDGRGADLLAGALETIEAAAFVCDSVGRVKSLTSAAEVAVRRGPLRLQAGKLSAARPADARALDDAIRVAVRGVVTPGDPARRMLLIRDADDPMRFEVVDVTPLPRAEFGFGFEPRAVVTVHRRRSDAQLSLLLQTAFALTGAEAAVVTRLAAGEARERIAEARQVSVETVRAQIKGAFAKMNIRREAELFALLTRLN
jgi:DNA-binding CsgD family transcriptional regulator